MGGDLWIWDVQNKICIVVFSINVLAVDCKRHCFVVCQIYHHFSFFFFFTPFTWSTWVSLGGGTWQGCWVAFSLVVLMGHGGSDHPLHFFLWVSLFVTKCSSELHSKGGVMQTHWLPLSLHSTTVLLHVCVWTHSHNVHNLVKGGNSRMPLDGCTISYSEYDNDYIVIAHSNKAQMSFIVVICNHSSLFFFFWKKLLLISKDALKG